eukprot:scaffold134469_cov39-Prasinocladus_malaysianus.AAC.1
MSSVLPLQKLIIYVNTAADRQRLYRLVLVIAEDALSVFKFYFRVSCHDSCFTLTALVPCQHASRNGRFIPSRMPCPPSVAVQQTTTASTAQSIKVKLSNDTVRCL